MSSHITYYDQMPIPPVPAQTEFIDAGPLRFGVEYRLLSEAVAAASKIATAKGGDKGAAELDDRGVSLHVYGVRGGEALEHLRFDCFDEDPTTTTSPGTTAPTSCSTSTPSPTATPSSGPWSASAPASPRCSSAPAQPTSPPSSTSARSTPSSPGIAEAAYRARYHHDDDAILADALNPA